MLELTLTHRRMKFLQMALLTVTGVVGLVTAISMGKVTRYFQQNCILYGSLRVRQRTAQSRPVLSVESTSSWGDEAVCDFVTFEGVLIFINAFIWMWFYLHMESIIRLDETESAVDRQLPRPNHPSHPPFPRSISTVKRESKAHAAIFVLPPIIINCLLCLASLVRASYITGGYDDFCDNMCLMAQTGQSCLHTSNTCGDLQKQNWTFLSGQYSSSPMYHDIMTAAVSLSWFEPVLLVSHIATIIVEVFLLTKPNSAHSSKSHSSSDPFDNGSRVALWPNTSDDEDDLEVEEEIDDSKARLPEANPPRSARPKFSGQSGGEANPAAGFVSGYDNPYFRKRPVPSRPQNGRETETVTAYIETTVCVPSPERSAAVSVPSQGSDTLAASVCPPHNAGSAARPQSLEVEAQIGETTQNPFRYCSELHEPSLQSAVNSGTEQLDLRHNPADTRRQQNGQHS